MSDRMAAFFSIPQNAYFYKNATDNAMSLTSGTVKPPVGGRPGGFYFIQVPFFNKRVIILCNVDTGTK